VIGVIVRPAAIEEADALSALANRSKASWGYDAAQIAAAPIRVEAAAIAEGWVWVAQDRRRKVLGVASLARTKTAGVIDLDALFVEPSVQREGVGEALMDHVSRMARALGAAALRIESDPNAVGFYERLGARRVGEARSAWGRMLPVYELPLKERGDVEGV
jgi:GNAT superfamily N-acetyltransferase